jgi:hypothetical protein
MRLSARTFAISAVLLSLATPCAIDAAGAVLPSISISDVTVAEGGAATTAVFNVTLSAPSPLTVNVTYATADGTATYPEDFLSLTSVLVFGPGETLKTVSVPIRADAFPEPTEAFVVNLSSAVNATIADAQGVATITDNDGSRLSIGDASVVEGRTGSTHAHFIVTLSPAHFATVTVNFATADGTAHQPTDYSPFGGTLSFAPGQTIQTISVPVLGDRFSEPNETFAVNLSNATTATIADSIGVGTIVNDEAALDDFDGDIKADLSVFRPSSRTWYTLTSGTGFVGFSAIDVGLSGDIPVPGDYDGDAKADIALYRPSTGAWIIRHSSTGAIVTYVWGRGTDAPVPGDYDGDARTDLAYYRPSTGVWSVLTSFSGYDPSAPLTFTLGTGTDIPVPADYDFDGTTDFAVFTPSTATWSITSSVSTLIFGWTSYYSFPFGAPGGVPVPGYYDDDGILDVATYQPSTGQWLALESSSGGNPGGRTNVMGTLGVAGDVPVPGDYDGDSRTDFAVYRPSTGEWLVLQSTTNFASSMTMQWGAPGDGPTVYAPVAAAIVIARRTVANSRRTTDLDGDGRGDLAVFRPSTGTWFNLRSDQSYTTASTFQWGLNGDLTVPGDYDGDGVTDLAVWRPYDGTWFWRLSGTGFTTSASFQWGLGGDVPVPGDYDGDGKADLAVWRPASGTWFIRLSSTAYATSTSFQWGLNGDVPVTGDYDGDGKTDLAVWRPSSGTWFIRTSSTNYTASLSFQWGLSGDITVRVTSTVTARRISPSTGRPPAHGSSGRPAGRRRCSTNGASAPMCRCRVMSTATARPIRRCTGRPPASGSSCCRAPTSRHSGRTRGASPETSRSSAVSRSDLTKHPSQSRERAD